MKVKIAKVAHNKGKPIAFTVKIRGLKYPKGFRDWYFPIDGRPETAIDMALKDYKQKDNNDKV